MPSRYEQHNQTSYLLMDAAYDCGAKDIAGKIYKGLNADLNQQMAYYASLGDNMTQKQLEDIIMEYSQKRYSAQIAQNNEQASQAEQYIRASLNHVQLEMVTEITRTNDFLQYVKQTEAKNGLTPKPAADTLKPALDSNALKPDSGKNK